MTSPYKHLETIWMKYRSLAKSPFRIPCCGVIEYNILSSADTRVWTLHFLFGVRSSIPWWLVLPSKDQYSILALCFGKLPRKLDGSGRTTWTSVVRQQTYQAWELSNLLVCWARSNVLHFGLKFTAWLTRYLNNLFRISCLVSTTWRNPTIQIDL